MQKEEYDLSKFFFQTKNFKQQWVRIINSKWNRSPTYRALTLFYSLEIVTTESAKQSLDGDKDIALERNKL